MKRLLFILLLFSCFAYGQRVDRFTRFSSGCTPDPAEVHTASNAVSDPNCNESNNTTGWAGFGGTGFGSTAGGLAGSDGGFKLQLATNTASGGERMWHQFTAVVGNEYQITAKSQIIVGSLSGTPGFKSFTGVTTNPTGQGFTTSVTDHNFTIEASSTTVEVRAYLGNAAMTVAIDEVSIVNLGDIADNWFGPQNIEHFIRELQKGYAVLIGKLEDEITV